MARNVYRGDKRRRELAKKKKREEKLARKQDKPPGEGEAETQDLSYLEYLHPGGVPEELLPDQEDEEDEDEDEDDDDD